MYMHIIQFSGEIDEITIVRFYDPQTTTSRKSSNSFNQLWLFYLGTLLILQPPPPPQQQQQDSTFQDPGRQPEVTLVDLEGEDVECPSFLFNRKSGVLKSGTSVCLSKSKTR